MYKTTNQQSSKPMVIRCDEVAMICIPKFSYRHVYIRTPVGFFVVLVRQDIYEINAKDLKNI